MQRSVPLTQSDFPCCASSLYSVRAAVTTPVGLRDASVAHFSHSTGLPHHYGGSAPTSDISRPAQRSLHAAARTDRWPSERAFSRSASAHLSPPGPLRVLPAGATVRRAGFLPAEIVHLGKAHTMTGSTGQDSGTESMGLGSNKYAPLFDLLGRTDSPKDGLPAYEEIAWTM